MLDRPDLAILVLVLLLQVKHALCDGPLQTRQMVLTKSQYGQAGGLVHAGLHGLGSAVALFLYGVDVGYVVMLALADTAIHYHVDFLKERVVRKNGWTTADTYFWWALAVDQTFHHVTYIAMAAAVVIWA
jgi:hypothetical protein